MKPCNVLLFCLLGMLVIITLSNVCWARAMEDYGGVYGTQEKTDTIPASGPGAFNKPVDAVNTNSGNSEEGGTPPAIPPATGPQTVYTDGAAQFYPSGQVAGGFNLGKPTALPSGTQVTQTGDTSLQITTGNSGGLFGIGFNNVTPVQLVTDPATGQIYSSGKGPTGYIVGPAWDSGISKENPFGKKK